MTGLERTRRVFAGQPVDRPPIVPIIHNGLAPIQGVALGRFFRDGVRIVDSAQAMVHALRQAFVDGALGPAPVGEDGSPADARASRYYATDRYHRFRELVRAFMGGRDVRVELLGLEDLAAALAARPATEQPDGA